jgi:hypothetical protein
MPNKGNCVCLNNQGAASDAPPVRRQTATKLPQATVSGAQRSGQKRHQSFDQDLKGGRSLGAVEAQLGKVLFWALPPLHRYNRLAAASERRLLEMTVRTLLR